MRRALALSALLSAASAAHGAPIPTWSPAVSAKGMQAYVHAGMLRAENHKVRVWVLYDFSKPQADPYGAPGVTFRSQEAYEEEDCANGSARTLQYTDFAGSMGAGATTYAFTLPSPTYGPPTYQLPGSVGMYLLKLVCEVAGDPFHG